MLLPGQIDHFEAYGRDKFIHAENVGLELLASDSSKLRCPDLVETALFSMSVREVEACQYEAVAAMACGSK